MPSRAIVWIMSRKLSKQQQRRQHENQDSQLKIASLDPALHKGQVMMRHGQQVWVKTADNRILVCHCRPHLAMVVTGDWVYWRDDEHQRGVIELICPRQTVFYKTIAGGKPLVANCNTLVLVFAPQPALSFLLLDKYLLAASHFNLCPLLVANKSDLAREDSDYHEAIRLYQRLGYPVYETSTLKPDTLRSLKEAICGQISLWVGQSGVGKSSLLKALLPNEEMIRVGEISALTQLGRHTTSNAKIYSLPEGGQVIDSAGVRDLALGPLSIEALKMGFIEYKQLGQCRFRNCSHRHEPHCEFQNALAKGALAPSRFESFLAFLEERGCTSKK